MIYIMITNHAHARINPPTSPLGEPKSKKIGFVAPMLIFPSAKISKTINVNMLCKHGTTNVNDSETYYPIAS